MNAPIVLAPLVGVSPMAAAAGGVPVTPGKGPTIATDPVGGKEYQAIKLALGGAGVAQLVEPGPRPAAECIPVVLANDVSIDIDATGLATEATLATLSTEATAAKETTLQAVETAVGLTASEATQLVGNVILSDLLAGQTAATALLTTMESQQDTTNSLLNDIKTNTASAGGVPPATAALTSVAASVTSVQLLATNTGRKGATVYNDSAAELLVRLGAPVAAGQFTLSMLPGSYFEVPFNYVGALYGMWASATGAARVTEITA